MLGWGKKAETAEPDTLQGISSRRTEEEAELAEKFEGSKRKEN